MDARVASLCGLAAVLAGLEFGWQPVTLVGGAASQSDPRPLFVRGQVGGSPRVVAIEGRAGYIGQRSQVVAYDLTDLGQPRELGASGDLGGMVVELETDSRFVGDDSGGLLVLSEAPPTPSPPASSPLHLVYLPAVETRSH